MLKAFKEIIFLTLVFVYVHHVLCIAMLTAFPPKSSIKELLCIISIVGHA